LKRQPQHHHRHQQTQQSASSLTGQHGAQGPWPYGLPPPPKAAQALIDQAQNAHMVDLPCGHHRMTEAPEPMLAALTDFLKP
jgi:pimeloyl-ACP methyl ester carboxylesterase